MRERRGSVGGRSLVSAAPKETFIVRITIIPREIQGAAPVWLGEICSVGDGKSRRLKHLHEILDFISHRLAEMGAPIGLWQRVRYRLRR
jgi:hypothetical protein